MKNLFSVLFTLFLLAACTAPSRYQQHQDTMPRTMPADINFTDAKPKYEPYYAPSLRPYKVLGKRYFPLTTGKGYQAEGRASWYGKKFHGHLTANGERYNMYALSAAHKTLPLPSYVKVTNLDNGRSAVVRVNDRGPFHDKRLIDLSYAAALKLGYLQQGVANVALEVVHVDKQGQLTVGTRRVNKEHRYIQVVALKNATKAQQLAKVLSQKYQVDSHISQHKKLFKLRLGPLTSADMLQDLLALLKKDGYQQAYPIATTLGGR